jgi:hypothetical protein
MNVVDNRNRYTRARGLEEGGKANYPVFFENHEFHVIIYWLLSLMPVLTIDRTVFFFLFFFLADLSYVGFVLVSDFWDISDRKQISLFVSKNKSSPMDLFLS